MSLLAILLHSFARILCLLTHLLHSSMKLCALLHNFCVPLEKLCIRPQQKKLSIHTQHFWWEERLVAVFQCFHKCMQSFLGEPKTFERKCKSFARDCKVSWGIAILLWENAHIFWTNAKALKYLILPCHIFVPSLCLSQSVYITNIV